MSDNQEKIIKAIQFLSENEFNDFVKLFNKVFFGTKDVFDSNGPYDGGRDLIIHVNGREIKKVIQITVQKTGLEKKIESDIGKAVRYVQREGFSSVMDFYTQQSLSNESQARIKRNALIKYRIEVSFYDCRRLAEFAEYDSRLKEFLVNHMNVTFSPEELSLDDNTKILYDAISQQQDIRDIKLRVVESSFLSYVYSQKEVELEALITWLDKLFCHRIPHTYYQSLAGRLNGKEIRLIPNTSPNRFCLSDDTRKRFEVLEFKSKQNEAELINSFRQVCSTYSIAINITELSELFQAFYKDVFAFDSAEILGKNITRIQQRIEKCRHNLVAFLESEIGDRPDIDVEKICSELIAVFESNDLYGKYAASQSFITLFNNDKLDRYLSQSPRYVLLDTPVLMHYICSLFKKTTTYQNKSYQAVLSLKNSIEESGVVVNLFTTRGYLKEVVVHLRQAIRLERFIHLPAFRSIGKSNNVFHNFYESVLSDAGYASIGEFVCAAFDMKDIPSNDDYLEYLLFSALEERLTILHITVCSSDFDLEEYMPDYEYALSNSMGENKSFYAKNHDLEALLYISLKMPCDETCPYLITWDKTFLSARRHFQRKFTYLNSWYLYSPQNFASTLSVLQFKLNGSMITRNVMSVIEENVNSSPEALSLLDAINSIVQGSLDTEMAFANSILRMRRSLMESTIEEEDASGVAVGELLSIILRNYAGDKEKSEILVLLFSDDTFSGEMRSILLRHIKDFRASDRKRVNALLKEVAGLVDSVEIDE